MRRPSGLVDFLDWHAYWVASRMRSDEIEQYVALVSQADYNFEHAARDFIRRGELRFTLLGEDGMPVMIGGFTNTGVDVWESWMAATDTAWDGHWRAITKATLWLADELFEQGARRLATSCLASRTKTREWYERSLGLKLEGILRQVGRDGEDVACYSRIKGEGHGRIQR